MLSAFSIFNGLSPQQGPKALRFNADFSTVLSIDLDLTKEQDLHQIDFIQSVFIDNIGSTSRLTIEINGVPFPLMVPALSQGMFPLVHSGHFKCKLSVNAVQTEPVSLVFLNVPQPYILWDKDFGPPLGLRTRNNELLHDRFNAVIFMRV